MITFFYFLFLYNNKHDRIDMNITQCMVANMVCLFFNIYTYRLRWFKHRPAGLSIYSNILSTYIVLPISRVNNWQFCQICRSWSPGGCRHKTTNQNMQTSSDLRTQPTMRPLNWKYFLLHLNRKWGQMR